MERPPRAASYAPSIKCSTCDADIPMQHVADHTCIQVTSTTIVEEPEHFAMPTSRTASNVSSTVGRPPRPFVPRIDPFLSNRTFANGELTPESSQGSLSQSPISPRAGKRSPSMRPFRKATNPTVRRPPSPELLSQDCAFPPFPTNKSKSQSNRNTVRGRAHTPEAGGSSRSFEQDARRSASAGAPRYRFRQGTGDSSRPSTANSSRQASLSSRAGSRKGSMDQVPPLPPLRPSLSHSTTASDSERRSQEQPTCWFPQSADITQAESVPFPELASMRSLRSSPEPTLYPPQEVEPPTVQLPPELPASSREPLYRAKRPPPMIHLPSSTVSKEPIPKPEPSPKEPPPPTPTSTLARTLTTFFGRRRNQSTSSKKGSAKTPATDGPRFIALSPEPDPQESSLPDPPPVDPATPEVTSTPPPSDTQVYLPASTEIPQPVQPIQDRFTAPNPESDAPEQNLRDSVRSEEEAGKTSATIGPMPRLSTVPEQVEDNKRVSIDSASSYSSEESSHSRRSSFFNNALNAHSYGSSISTARTTTSSEEFPSSAFAKLRGVDAVPDSPTDPYMQHGRLAPVPESQSFRAGEMAENTPPVPATAPAGLESERGYFDLVQFKQQRRPSTPGASRGICRGCSQMILAGQKSVSSKDGRLTGRYHKECFACKTCKEAFATADFYVHHDYPYCAHDYHVVNETLCESCGNGIEGHYLETSNLTGNGAKKFHPHCLRCATCKIQLNDDYFELGGRVYCEKDAFRLINGPGPRSPYGTAPSRPSPLNREYISSGEPGQVLRAGKFPERRLTRLMTT